MYIVNLPNYLVKYSQSQLNHHLGYYSLESEIFSWMPMLSFFYILLNLSLHLTNYYACSLML
jgi:hypothetical protein